MTLNKVKKGIKFTYVTHQSYMPQTVTKFDWICAECGLVWGSRKQAQSCAEREHRESYLNHWGKTLRARRKVKLEEK